MLTVPMILAIALTAQSPLSPLPTPLAPGHEPPDANRFTNEIRTKLVMDAGVQAAAQRGLTDSDRREWINRRLVSMTIAEFEGLSPTAAEKAEIWRITNRMASTYDARALRAAPQRRVAPPPPVYATPTYYYPTYYAPRVWTIPCAGGNCARR